jgi:uroporphyrinogen-III synthase
MRTIVLTENDKFTRPGIDMVKMFDVEFINQSKLNDIFSNMTEYDSVIVTSQNACRALGSVKIHSSWQSCYVVGPATALAMRQLGFTNIVGQTSGSSAELAKLINHNQRLLFLTGDKTMLSLPFVDRLQVYLTVPIDPRSLKAIDWQDSTVVFFSPSAVELVFSAVPLATLNVECIAIGPTTGRALSKFVKCKSCEAPTPECLFRLLDAV